jgi:hypothetical protein
MLSIHTLVGQEQGMHGCVHSDPCYNSATWCVWQPDTRLLLLLLLLLRNRVFVEFDQLTGNNHGSHSNNTTEPPPSKTDGPKRC